MARGFDSKAVESQQDDARAAREKRANLEKVDPARHALELARARVVADLARATQPAHRQMLETALADLDRALTRPAER
jgi:hypothetical protein